MTELNSGSPLQLKIREIIFGTNTPAGKGFDVALIIGIVLSVVAVMLDSVKQISEQHHELLYIVEWTFTLLFTAEYIARVYSAPKPWAYVRSFYGIIDLLSILPTYLSMFLPSLSYLMIIRIMRVLRIFRVLKLMRYMNEASVLLRTMGMARRKILVFFSTVTVFTCIYGAILYLVEGPEHGFTSIPMGIYWAIVTITTVGYGDIAPQTPFGQFIASLAMMTGYAIIAVPSGIISAEMFKEIANPATRDNRECYSCHERGHEYDANFCKYCGYELEHVDSAES